MLEEEFNANYKEPSGPGELYFTDKSSIHEWYDYGCWLRVIELPIDNPYFRVVKDVYSHKWRANMLILKDKYSLSDIKIYKKFNIQLPNNIPQSVLSGTDGKLFME